MLQFSKKKLYTTGRLILCTCRQELLSFTTHSSPKLLLFGILSLFLSFHPPLLNWFSGSLLSYFILYYLNWLHDCFSYISAIHVNHCIYIIISRKYFIRRKSKYSNVMFTALGSILHKKFYMCMQNEQKLEFCRREILIFT